MTPPLAGYNSTVAKGGGFLAVNQSMVDAFFTKNGRTITDPESGYQTAGFSDFKAPYDIKARKTYNQWINREPRFYVDVTYNNSYWINQGTSPTPVIVDYTYTGNSGRKNSSTNLAATGYNVRKQLTSSTSSRSWCYIRLAQIYLDYVEALNEYDPGNSDILTYLNKIRQRAGIPIYGNGANDVPVPSSQAAMRTAIWNERQVELAFEEVRYFDVRRWRVAAQTMGASVYGMNMFGDSTTFYQKTLDQTRRFLPRDYLWPIPNTEVLVNNSMVQNPGW
ncbi:MAG: RagB/SusD family nutrient uptake outer membrane protein [Arachidicoccus sp.]|nr:RagB/SusD family nutrient uptake outer membrane protein [Arachidicoccus sp.]